MKTDIQHYIFFKFQARKSPALKRIKDAVTSIQDKKQKKFAAARDKADTSTRAPKTSTPTPPQILIDVFSMEEMHNVLMRNNYQVFLQL